MRLDPLLLGGGVGLAGMLTLAPVTGEALGSLAKARSERARWASEAAAPPAAAAPLVAEGLRTDPAALTARVRALAKQGGVLVEEMAPLAADGPLLRFRIRLSAPEKALIAWADRIEREAPLARFARWRLAPAPGGVRLDGELVAVRS